MDLILCALSALGVCWFVKCPRAAGAKSAPSTLGAVDISKHAVIPA